MKVNPQIPIELDKPRTLWLNFNAMRLFEKETGKKFVNSLSDPSIDDLTVILWAALKHEDPDVTVDQLGEALGLGDIEYVMGKIMEAWEAATPDKKKQGKKVSLPNGTG